MPTYLKIMNFIGGSGFSEGLNGPTYVVPEDKVEEFLDRYGRDKWAPSDIPAMVFIHM